MEENEDAACKFVEENRAALIERLSKADAISAADHLLKMKCFSNEAYTNIRKATTSFDCMRELYDAMIPAKPISYFEFYKYLEEKHPCVLKVLKRGNKTQKRKETSGTSEDHVGKWPRTQEPPATETGSDQNQGQEARNETDSGSTPGFQHYTLSAMHEYLEDPDKSESMIRVLKSKLGEEGMENLENLLEGIVPKPAVCLNHEDFKNIYKSQVLTGFLKSGELPNVPTKLIDQFFVKIKGYDKISTAMPVTGLSDSGHKSLNHDKPSLSIHSPPHEAQRECETTPAATSGDCPQTSLDIGAENVDRNQDPIGKPKKGQSKQVFEKKMLLRKYQTDTLRQWAVKQILSEKSGSNQEEELKKIKDAITIVDVKQHPLYPLLLAENCKVFKDPQTQRYKVIEIPDRDLKTVYKNSNLDFKVQFHMLVLNISETVVLLKDGKEKTLSLHFEMGDRYNRYIQEVVVPVFAVFKKVQREKELF